VAAAAEVYIDAMATFQLRRAGSWRVQSPLANAERANLQGCSSVAIITRNEGVRGSNPRVGFPKWEIPA
jgi:hypothetical protein